MADGFIPYDGPIVTREAASANGVKRYFIGEICHRGHVSERMTSSNLCVQCRREDEKKYCDKHREKIRAKVRKQSKNPSEHRRAYNSAKDKERRAKLADELNARRRARYAENREKELAINAIWRAKNKERSAESNRRWQKENPERMRAAASKRRAVKLNADGFHTTADINEIRSRQKDRCGYCRKRLTGAGHLDHIVPLCRGGSNWPRNLQWLCAPCNQKKNRFAAEDFARKIGLLI